MNINVDFLKIVLSLLLPLFNPVINFFKKEGLWDPLVALWNIVASVASAIWTWLHTSATAGKLLDWLVVLLKLILDILITLFNILGSAVNWLIGNFK